MLRFDQTEEFKRWLKGLRDDRAILRIASRLKSAAYGNFGDCGPVSEGVSEMRIHYGPGYRLYYKRVGDVVYLLLLGGEKTSQKRDIRQAIELARMIGGERS
ncbi:type II toxin-antitoxin system RelE/ParE family toxin [Rhizobium sp.]